MALTCGTRRGRRTGGSEGGAGEGIRVGKGESRASRPLEILSAFALSYWRSNSLFEFARCFRFSESRM